MLFLFLLKEEDACVRTNRDVLFHVVSIVPFVIPLAISSRKSANPGCQKAGHSLEFTIHFLEFTMHVLEWQRSVIL